MKPNGCTLLHSKLKPSGIFYFWFRSSRSEVYCKKCVLKNFAKFTGKHLSQSLFLNKVAGSWNFIKKETLAQVFSCELFEISKNTFFIEHLWTTASVTLVIHPRPKFHLKHNFFSTFQTPSFHKTSFSMVSLISFHYLFLLKLLIPITNTKFDNIAWFFYKRKTFSEINSTKLIWINSGMFLIHFV